MSFSKDFNSYSQDVHHHVDSSEAMKSHISNQIKNKQEQTAIIQQLERNIEENKIDKDTNISIFIYFIFFNIAF